MTTTFTTETELRSCQKIKCTVSMPEYEGKVLSLVIVDNDTKETVTTFFEKDELLQVIETLSILSKLMKG